METIRVAVTDLSVFARKHDSSFWDFIEDWEGEKQNKSSDYNRGKFAEVHTAAVTTNGVYYRVGNAYHFGQHLNLEIDSNGEIADIQVTF